ncbi:MAG: glycosyltransferase family A protein [Atribacterota bacterium]|nr:glycosyltransferase family A protein [Atribacterota bacterium]MDD4895554.1 glycosyltransferase family A protein [Atribacterota bacterium]MDD5636497.1 glycosyltransferase family A protein [Atribacterota bacterium]
MEKLKDKEVCLSIIIPAKNEEKNTGKVLNSIKRQSYEPYEIIVVNDKSTDKTEAIASTYSGIKIISLDSEPPKG